LHQKQLEEKRKALEKKEQDENDVNSDEKKKDSSCQGEAPDQDAKKDESILNHEQEKPSSPDVEGGNEVSESQTDPPKTVDPAISVSAELNSPSDAPL